LPLTYMSVCHVRFSFSLVRFFFFLRQKEKEMNKR